MSGAFGNFFRRFWVNLSSANQKRIIELEKRMTALEQKVAELSEKCSLL